MKAFSVQNTTGFSEIRPTVKDWSVFSQIEKDVAMERPMLYFAVTEFRKWGQNLCGMSLLLVTIHQLYMEINPIAHSSCKSFFTFKYMFHLLVELRENLGVILLYVFLLSSGFPSYFWLFTTLSFVSERLMQSCLALVQQPSICTFYSHLRLLVLLIWIFFPRQKWMPHKQPLINQISFSISSREIHWNQTCAEPADFLLNLWHCW